MKSATFHENVKNLAISGKLYENRQSRGTEEVIMSTKKELRRLFLELDREKSKIEQWYAEHMPASPKVLREYHYRIKQNNHDSLKKMRRLIS